MGNSTGGQEAGGELSRLCSSTGKGQAVAEFHLRVVGKEGLRNRWHFIGGLHLKAIIPHPEPLQELCLPMPPDQEKRGGNGDTASCIPLLHVPAIRSCELEKPNVKPEIAHKLWAESSAEVIV